MTAEVEGTGAPSPARPVPSLGTTDEVRAVIALRRRCLELGNDLLAVHIAAGRPDEGTLYEAAIGLLRAYLDLAGIEDDDDGG